MKRIITLLLITTVNLISAQINLSSSLTACYALNGNGIEPINNLTATLSAVTSTVDRFNNSSSALAFSGTSSSYIELPDNPLLKPTTAFSFFGWIKTSVVANQYILMTKNPGSNNFETYCLVLANISGQLRIRAQKGNGIGSTAVITGTTNLSINTWYHFGITVDNSVMNLYSNGTLAASTSITFPFSYQPNKTVVLGGSNESSFNLPYTGSMDNLRFYNRIINASEVSALYTTDPSCLAVPISSFSALPSTLCAGGSVVFSDLSSNTPNAWSWQVPGGTASSLTTSNTTATFQNPGTYVVSMTSSNTAGAGNTATQAITILPNPTVTISSPNSFCQGQTGTLTAYGANTYSWSSGQSGSSIVVGPNNISTSYSVLGTNTNGCTGSALQSITLNTVLPTISVSGSGTICQGSPTSLLAGGSAITFTWSNGATGNLVTVTPTVSTVYTVSGTGVSGCTVSATQLVFVNSAPSVFINASNSSICLGEAVTLNASGAVSYLWSGGVVDNVAFYPSTTSSYSVVGTGTNSCKNTATVQIVVNPLPVLTHSILTTMPVCAGEPITLSAGGANIYNWSNGTTLPTAIVNPTIASSYTVIGTDANGCKDSHVFMLTVEPCTSLKETTSNVSVRIFPNPNHGQFVIKGLSSEYKNLKVLNLLGEVIVQKDLFAQSDEMLINIESQPKGIYFIILSNETSHKTFKFVKE